MMSASAQYPRMLIVGYGDLSPGTGGGVTMASLCEGWPRDRIAIAAGGRDLGASGFAGHYYRLGASEDRWVWPLSVVPRQSWKVSGQITPGTDVEQERDTLHLLGGVTPDEKSRSHAGPDGYTRRMVNAVLGFAGAKDLVHGLQLSHSFTAWVAEYRPEVVYSWVSTLGLARLLNHLAEETDARLALHFMDDWPSADYQEGALAPVLRRKLERELRSLVDRAAVVMAISDAMSREYARRYGRDFLTFHNALDLGEWAATRRTSWEATPPIEVLYTGRIGIANGSSLVDVAQAVARPALGGIQMRFTVLTPDVANPVAAKLRAMQCVEVVPAIPHAQIPARLAEADLLVLPLDFGHAEQKFARYSMPTKAVEYMASGVPTVVYAPAEHAVSQYAASGGWGLLVGTRDVGALTAAFRSLATDSAMREHFGRRAVELASANHNEDVVREAFRAALYSAAHSARSASPLRRPSG